MPFADESDTECEGQVEAILRQDGVVRRSLEADCGQKNTDSGIQFPKETEVSSCNSILVSDGNDKEFASFEPGCQSMPESGVTDVPVAENKPETGLQRGGEHFPKSIPEREHLPWGDTSFPMLSACFLAVVVLVLRNNSLVGANEFGIRCIGLNCVGPPSNVKNWLAGRTTIVKNKMLNQNCPCCKHLMLSNETQNLNIFNISSGELCDYQCEMEPKSVDIWQFPLKEFFKLCSPEELLKGTGRKEVELRRNVDSEFIYYVNVTVLNGTLVMFPATRVRQSGSPYCNVTLGENDDDPSKNETHTGKPVGNEGENASVIISAGIVLLLLLLLLLCLVYQLVKTLLGKKEDGSSSEAVKPEERE